MLLQGICTILQEMLQNNCSIYFILFYMCGRLYYESVALMRGDQTLEIF